MDQNFIFWFSAPHGHKQGLQNQIYGLPALVGPAHDTPGLQVHDDSQIDKAFVGFDVCNVCDPCRIRCIDAELRI